MKTLTIDKNEAKIIKSFISDMSILWNQVRMYLYQNPQASLHDLLNIQKDIAKSNDIELNLQILQVNTKLEWMMWLKSDGLTPIYENTHRYSFLIPKFTFLNQMFGKTLPKTLFKDQCLILDVNDQNLSSIKVEPLA